MIFFITIWRLYIAVLYCNVYHEFKQDIIALCFWWRITISGLYAYALMYTFSYFRYLRNIDIVYDIDSIQINHKSPLGESLLEDVGKENIKCKWVKIHKIYGEHHKLNPQWLKCAFVNVLVKSVLYFSVKYVKLEKIRKLFI